MNSSGITRGVAATAIAALAVAGLPLLSSPAHAVPTTLEIINVRDRSTFDLDELRDGDDFKLRVLDETGKAISGTTPEYRWVLDTGGTPVEGAWLTAEKPALRKVFRVEGPSRNGGLDTITDAMIQAGTWTLEARAPGLPDADPVDVKASESEITLDAPVTNTDGTQTVSGTLANATDPLAGRAVELTYTRKNGRGDARIQGAASDVTGPDGDFEVTLVDPNGATGQAGSLRATGSGEVKGDLTQLLHRYGPNDIDDKTADATDTQAVTWEGPPGSGRTAIVATLDGRSNKARADVVKVVAPTKAHDAGVRLFRVARNGSRTLLQTRQLNQTGDKKFRVKDRNRRGFTTYVAKVGATSRTLGDETNRRRVR